LHDPNRMATHWRRAVLLRGVQAEEKNNGDGGT